MTNTYKEALDALSRIKEFIHHYSPTKNTFDEEIETIRAALQENTAPDDLVKALEEARDDLHLISGQHMGYGGNLSDTEI